jgi:hypothetical protein
VKDATADYSDEMMRAALDINIPNYASAIVTAAEIVTLIDAPGACARTVRFCWTRRTGRKTHAQLSSA